MLEEPRLQAVIMFLGKNIAKGVHARHILIVMEENLSAMRVSASRAQNAIIVMMELTTPADLVGQDILPGKMGRV